MRVASPLVLDVHAFERLLGPCMDVMKRNIGDYEGQLVKIFGSLTNITDIRWRQRRKNKQRGQTETKMRYDQINLTAEKLPSLIKNTTTIRTKRKELLLLFDLNQYRIMCHSICYVATSWNWAVKKKILGKRQISKWNRLISSRHEELCPVETHAR